MKNNSPHIFKKIMELFHKEMKLSKSMFTKKHADYSESKKRMILSASIIVICVLVSITTIIIATVNSKDDEAVLTSSSNITSVVSDTNVTDEQQKKTGFVIITGTSVNVRFEADANSEKLSTIEKSGGEYPFLCEQLSSDGTNWYQIVYNDIAGWVSSEYAVRIEYSEEYINDYISALIKTSGTVGVQTAAFEQGKIVNCWSCGYAQLPDVPMDDDTKIRIASLSKLIVAINAMKMQELGIIDVSSPIDTYWDSSYPKSITMRSLLSHTSTLWEQDYPKTRQETITQLSKSSSYANYEIGSVESWKYNNYAIGIAGSTLEAASDSLLEEFGRYHFFDPMGIDASWYAGNFKANQLAELYYVDGSVARSSIDASMTSVKDDLCVSAGYFSGALNISAKDYAKLVAMIANDGIYNETRYLNSDSVSIIEQPLLETTENGQSFTQCMPLRYNKDLLGEEEIYYHTGNAYGVSQKPPILPHSNLHA